MLKYLRFSWLFGLLCLLPYSASAVAPTAENVIVNEIMAANVDQFWSPSVNFDGWIELYNPTGEAATMAGIYMSDDPANLKKWKAPSTFGFIPAHGYKVVWFDYTHLCNTNTNFKLDVDGGTIYISDANGQLITSQAYPEAMERISYARTIDGGEEWGYTAEPTPGTTNNNGVYATQQLDIPEVSHPDQLFNGSITVRVNIPDGVTLRYTTDGTLPTMTNGMTSNTGRFVVSRTTCYRFRYFQNGKLPSRVASRSYILRDKNYSGPVIAVISDPDFLYGSEHGVMVRGTGGVPGHGQSSPCNWNMDWERPVNFAYMLPGEPAVINQDVNLEMCGGWSRAWEPHSFKLKGNKEYGGNKNLEYPFFDEKPYIRNRTLQIRNGGNNNWDRFKDPAIESIILTSGIDIDAQSYRPIHEFINGQYIGMLNMREPNNKHFVYANMGWDDDEIDMFEMDPDSSYVQQCGTKDSYLALYELTKTAASADSYNEIKQLLDIDEYTNYMAMELYLGSTDWPQNNLKGYRHQDNGRFRFVSFDLDFAFNTSNTFNDFANKRNYTFDRQYNTGQSIRAEIQFVTIFLNLLKNDDFRRRFIDTYCIMGGSVFEPTRCAEIIDSLATRAYALQQLEWGSTPWDMASELKTKFNTRMATMTNTIRNYSPMKLSSVSAQRTKLKSNVDGGVIYINDIVVPTGYFNGNLFAPVTLRAEAPAGYTFDGWATTSSSQSTLFPRGESWKYYDKGSLDGNNWQAENYNTSTWKDGNAPLGYGKDGLNTTISYGSSSNNKYPTYYFRKEVNLSTAPASSDIFTLDFTIDDGLVVYVNGTEAGRYNMPSGNISYNTFASTYAPNNPDTGQLQLPTRLFHQGTNIIAVEVHNNSATSSDIYWDAALTYNSTSNISEFYSNDAEISLPSGTVDLMACFTAMPDEQMNAEGIHPIRINEVSADNSVYINDYYKKADWIELYNTTSASIDVEGMYLSDKEGNPHKYQIIGNGVSTIIPAHGHLLVWCDKKESINELHADFKLANEGGVITLTAADDSWSDSLSYPEHDGNSTVGRYPDGSGNIYTFNIPTIRKPNRMSSYIDLFTSQTEGIDTPMATHTSKMLTMRYGADRLIVRGENNGPVMVEIYTIAGQLVDRVNTDMFNGYAETSTSSLAKGCYVAHVTTRDGKTTSCKFAR